jgi:molybdate transport system substrate-binding protein
MLKVFSSNGVRGVILDLAPAFEQKAGERLDITFEPANLLKERILRDEKFDAAILTPEVMTDVIAQRKIAKGSERTIARVGCGLGVRAGAAKPDTGSVESFKRALLNAKSIARTRQGASGIHFTSIIRKLGIAAEVDAKSRFLPSGLTGELAARGETELAVQLISELKAVPGVDITPFPDELQKYVVMVGGVSAAPAQPKAAAELVALLSGPEAAAILSAKGMERAV